MSPYDPPPGFTKRRKTVEDHFPGPVEVQAGPAGSRTVIGCDPSLTAVGLVILRWAAERGDRWSVLARATVKTTERSTLPARCGRIAVDVAGLVQHWLLVYEPIAIVVENPTDQVHVNRKRAGKTSQAAPSSIALLGVGVGAVLTALEVLVQADPLVLVDAGAWIPRVQTGGWGHPMQHDQAVSRLRALYGVPADATDHEVMAAGVAGWWLRRDRERELRGERGIPDPPPLGRRSQRSKRPT